MYSILTSKNIHKDEHENTWRSEKISEYQLIPKNYIDWYNRNLDHLEILKNIDPEEYNNKLIQKLIELYDYNIDSSNNIHQNISANPLIDIHGNSLIKSNIEEHKEIAIKFYLQRNIEPIKINCESKVKLIEDVLNFNLKNIPENFCLKFINSQDTIASIVHIASKGTINIL